LLPSTKRRAMKRSGGVLLWRRSQGHLEVLLVHPGGPFWRKKDEGSWQIPKGLLADGENSADAARRETEEELGVVLRGELVPLMSIRQAGGKVVEAFALEQDLDADAIKSNDFEMEWPPRSGRLARFPEVDAARWLSLDEAGKAMLASQLPLLRALKDLLGV
jgi:predicted NUDIX family NTP pyrophosphohydrolase